MIKAHHEEREALLATAPAVYEAGWATISTAWVRVRLDLTDPAEVFELLEEAWRMTATKRAIKAYDEALDPCQHRNADRRTPLRDVLHAREGRRRSSAGSHGRTSGSAADR